MIKFTELIDKLPYPSKLRNQIMSYHSRIFEWACDNYTGSKSCQVLICKAFNLISYLCIMGESIPIDWSPENVSKFTDIDNHKIESALHNLYVNFRNIKWDIPIVDRVDTNSTDDLSDTVENQQTFTSNDLETVDNGVLTPPEDLFLQGPKIPRIDTSKIWMKGEAFGHLYCIYTSLPEIPTKQSEISVTTDVNKMLPNELLRLFPTRRLYTRDPILYKKIESCDYHPLLGTVLNISGFTLEQRIENIIKYPHLEGLVREGRRKGDFVYSDFWKYIEIDGTLHRIRDVWDDLEDTHNLPSHPGLMCDYVVRRYLLERDVNHMNHKYQLYGTLEPFLTLCFTADDYTSLGYTDLVEIAKQCVRSRVSYKQSRNPIIRRLKQNA